MTHWDNIVPLNARVVAAGEPGFEPIPEHLRPGYVKFETAPQALPEGWHPMSTAPRNVFRIRVLRVPHPQMKYQEALVKPIINAGGMACWRLIRGGQIVWDENLLGWKPL